MKKVVIGIGVGVVCVVGLVVGGIALIKKNREPDEVDHDNSDFIDYEEIYFGDDGHTEEICDDDEGIFVTEELASMIQELGYQLSNFDDDQLKALDYCLSKGFDIKCAIDPVYDGEQMTMIISGKYNGFDPLYYAKPDFSYMQMRRML